MDVVENVPGEIMMVSTDFVMKALELIDLLGFDFVVAMVFNFVDEESCSL